VVLLWLVFHDVHQYLYRACACLPLFWYHRSAQRDRLFFCLCSRVCAWYPPFQLGRPAFGEECALGSFKSALWACVVILVAWSGYSQPDAVLWVQLSRELIVSNLRPFSGLVSCRFEFHCAIFSNVSFKVLCAIFSTACFRFRVFVSVCCFNRLALLNRHKCKVDVALWASELTMIVSLYREGIYFITARFQCVDFIDFASYRVLIFQDDFRLRNVCVIDLTSYVDVISTSTKSFQSFRLEIDGMRDQMRLGASGIVG